MNFFMSFLRRKGVHKLTLVDRIRLLANQRGLSLPRLEEELNMGNGTISRWRTSAPGTNKLEKVADYFGVSIDYLIGRTETPISNGNSNKGIRIPVLGNVAAGIPIEMITDVVDWEEIPDAMAKAGDFFGLRIKGDSMSPRISEGDTVIVRKQDDAESGDVIIATINGDSATCKRLMKYESGISLISFNPAYKPMEFTNEQITTVPVHIIGKVVENRQKY